MKLLTGYEALDNTIKGLKKSELMVLASRPAMGKTSLAFNIATNVAIKENVPVLLFSLEMSKEQCINRILCSEALIDMNKLNSRELDNNDCQKLDKATQKLSKAEINIDDTPAISIEEIKTKCVKLKKEKDIELVVIDYLQLIRGNQNCLSRDIEVEGIICELKELSRELDISILLISQLSKAPEKRFSEGKDPRPVVTDVSECMIQNADIMIFLYRNDYYYRDTDHKNIAEIIVAKNRYGDCSTIKLKFYGKYLKFANLDE